MRWSVLLSSSALVLQSRGPEPAVDETVARPAFDYHLHGEEWSVGECGSRKRQSPVDFDPPLLAAGNPATGNLSYSYEPITYPFRVQNNAHGIAADLSGQGIGGLYLDGSFYSLQTITFHARSEHTLGGKKFPLEVHLVHKRYDGDALAVAAFWVESPQLPRVPYGEADGVGDALPDPRLAFFADPPTPMNFTQAVATELQPLDFAPWFAEERFLAYEGSLTVPPCSEIAMWFVREKPVPASNAQVSALFHSLFQMALDIGNARATMPLMGRTVRVVTAAPGSPVAEGGLPPKKGEYVEPTVRAFQGLTAAKEAKDAVQANIVHMRDLDARIKAASAAQPKALAGWLPPATPEDANGYRTGVPGANGEGADISMSTDMRRR